MVWGLKTLCTWLNAAAPDNHGATLLYTRSCDCWFSRKQPSEELVRDAGLVTVQAERLRAWFVSNFKVSKFMRFLHFRTCHAFSPGWEHHHQQVCLARGFLCNFSLSTTGKVQHFQFPPLLIQLTTQKNSKTGLKIQKPHAGTYQQKKHGNHVILVHFLGQWTASALVRLKKSLGVSSVWVRK